MANKIVKTAVDAAMYVLFLLLMEYHLLPEAVHEWLGVSVFILFLAHNALNYKWYAVLFRGRYTAMRIIQTVVNFLLWIAMICCMLSGALISGTVFAWLDINGAQFGRTLHLIATAWAFILISVHLGLHWHIFVGMTKRIKTSEVAASVIRWISRAVVLAVGIYGAVVFIGRDFYEELFFLTEFKQFDYEISAFLYLLQSLAMSVTFAGISYYIKKLGLFLKKFIRRKKNEKVN